ncbi:MAG: hypothetical protein AB7S49_04955 [Arcobacter sp.]|jgi:hypothetical protein|uniref:Uncharacterized protein n=1 Tax=Arcobacter defluvii TaxID=873191 RepID=A0AAE7E764_9BACT|nr:MULTISPECIES: hypothetical protein [Arcobacter]MDY3200808.1 hypothetical protein [Arcobacter sp.]QKF78097.1 hypothetical protein ADFLV_2088 [Arcobacter defluvii]RXI33208.1 hypothetical protein CP964_06440 [Arcobacter defluvii]BAK73915.1 hypothetical protein ABLL_2040 [Arcobacter sp. L]
MSKLNNGEPSLNKIDDYNGNESKQKRNTVRLVIILCLVVGGLIAYFKATSAPSDYVGTNEQPGISTTK